MFLPKGFFSRYYKTKPEAFPRFFNPLFISILFVQFGKYQYCCGLNAMENISKVKGKCIFNKIQYYEKTV